MTQNNLSPVQAWLKRKNLPPQVSPNTLSVQIQSDSPFSQRRVVGFEWIITRKRVWTPHYNVRGGMRKRKAAAPAMRIESYRRVPVYETITPSLPYLTWVDKLNP
jgi:hypothetical protein